MNKSKQILFLFFFFWSLKTAAQDFQFGQFYAVPLYYNPAFAGSNLNSRFTAGYRSQWTGLQGWRGWLASFDLYLKNASSGAGIYFSNNRINRLGYSHTSAMVQYAYRSKISRKVRLSTGIGLGFGQVSWDFSNLTFGDQLVGDPVAPFSADQVANRSLSAFYPDIQIGFLIYTQKWWVSLSGLHPHSPTFELSGENQIEMRTNLSFGYRFEMEKPTDYQGEISPNAITPAVLIRNQGTASQLDLGVYIHYVPFVFGVWYRGLPTTFTSKSGESRLNRDALTALMGIKQNNLSIGYSYDINLSGLVGVLGGSHEISLTYEFKTKYLSLKGLKQSKALPCPSF
jgi:type IX secretion system PorP/SprF family membrane protein